MVHEEELNRVQTLAAGLWHLSAAQVRLSLAQATALLRWSLATVFFWFGMLKVAGQSPVVELLNKSYPALSTSSGFELLGLLEIGIAAGLLIKSLSKPAAVLMIIHLICTLSIVFITPSLVFAPSFPLLTMEGEFIAKNIVFIIAGLLIVFAREK